MALSDKRARAVHTAFTLLHPELGEQLLPPIGTMYAMDTYVKSSRESITLLECFQLWQALKQGETEGRGTLAMILLQVKPSHFEKLVRLYSVQGMEEKLRAVYVELHQK